MEIRDFEMCLRVNWHLNPHHSTNVEERVYHGAHEHGLWDQHSAAVDFALAQVIEDFLGVVQRVFLNRWW